MKFEVGKFYKTRGGDKARIDVIVTDQFPEGSMVPSNWIGSRRMAGTVYHDGKPSRWQSWTGDGKLYNYNTTNEYDIVGEWREPPSKR